jgi:D-alanyl-lipoteichoic acid acyltransferase DltB (MBOAT superfamily)
MLFNSLDFAVFLPLVFGIYWLLKNYHLKYQNTFLLLSSYVFYGWWDWGFLLLIAFSTAVDFIIGNLIFKTEKASKRKILLSLSLVVNLGLLGFFKYFNFFIDNVNQVFSFLGKPLELRGLEIILPVGISFYTFQTLSYTLDIYHKKLKPTNNFIAFAGFVSFFPQLVAGPIERARNLLPQFETKRIFNSQKSVDGLRQILWGLFKKIVIADQCALIVNDCFANPEAYNASTLAFGAIFFAIQIYGDFSGYSDIAIGTARLFGFNLMKNFAFPYFSRNIAEFWRRWHISLSTWFRDYVYIPLGGSKGTKAMVVRNIFAVFLISALWHGANWTFIIWGLIHALCYMPLLFLNTTRTYTDTVAVNQLLPNLKELLSILFTFILTTLAWIFFRAETVGHAFNYLNAIWSESIWQVPNFGKNSSALITLLLVGFMLVIEWIAREHNFALEKLATNWKRPLRWTFYYLIILSIFYFFGSEQEFIYFQF